MNRLVQYQLLVCFGVSLANAVMEAETKSKRRVALSICRLAFLDETEVDSMDRV